MSAMRMHYETRIWCSSISRERSDISYGPSGRGLRNLLKIYSNWSHFLILVCNDWKYFIQNRQGGIWSEYNIWMFPALFKWAKGNVQVKRNYAAFGNAIKENTFDELFEQRRSAARCSITAPNMRYLMFMLAHHWWPEGHIPSLTHKSKTYWRVVSINMSNSQCTPTPGRQCVCGKII